MRAEPTASDVERGARCCRVAWRGALTLLVIAAVACSGDTDLRNVLLISIDSLRADHLGTYGYSRETSPTLDRLAAEGVRFEHATSPTSWTLPAHVTLLSGRAQRHHRTLAIEDTIPASEELLAEALARHGYETVGFFSGPFLHPAYGFARGFSEYISCRKTKRPNVRPDAWQLSASHSDETSSMIRSEFGAWLERRSERPFFAFVHMWDVHYDYIPPEPYASMFDRGYAGRLDGRAIARDGFPASASADDVAHLVALYDGEIRYVDATIGELLRTLHESGLLRRTLVVVTADHGDEFREHGGKGHWRTLFEEVVRVPLIFWASAGLPRGEAVAPPVSLEDVAPTILSFLGLEGLARADGRDLLPLVRGGERVSRPLYGALFRWGRLELTSLRRGQTKLIYRPGSQRWTQYDLGADPGETDPRVPARELRRMLLGYTEEARTSVPAPGPARERPGPADLPPEVQEQLEMLGYLE